MKIVLNKANPSTVLVIAALNAVGTVLPEVDEATGKFTISPGSVGIKFDTDTPAVDAQPASNNELEWTFTKNIKTGASVFAVATGLNENGEVIKSDPLEIVIEADPADGIAASLVFQVKAVPVPETAAASSEKAATYTH